MQLSRNLGSFRARSPASEWMARSRPRGDARTGGLDLVDQGHDIAGITGIPHRQPRRKHEAGGGLGDNPRLAAKLGGAVALAFADRGNGGIIGIDDFTVRQGLAVGEAAGLGGDLLMGGEGHGQRGVPARPLVFRQLRRRFARAPGRSAPTPPPARPSSAAGFPSGAPSSQRLSPAPGIAAQSGA